jgi:uncharacterized protein (DUF433 family)
MTFEPAGTRRAIRPSQPRVSRRPLGPAVDIGETAVSEDAGSVAWADATQATAAPVHRRATDAQRQPNAAELQRARRQLWRDAARGLERINLERLPRGGEPTLGMTSISIGQVLGLISEGYSVERITAEYQGLIDECDVRDALIFALRLSS